MLQTYTEDNKIFRFYLPTLVINVLQKALFVAVIVYEPAVFDTNRGME